MLKINIKICTGCHLEKPFPEFSKGNREADGLQDRCKACNAKASAEYRKLHREKEKIRHAKYAQKNKEKLTLKSKKWAQNNKEKCRAKAKRYYERNKEKETLRNKEYRKNNSLELKNKARQYQINNKPKINSIRAKYVAAQKNATPLWSNLMEIEKFYILATQKTNETGTEHSVDHIVPLTSKIVCGLHCQHNLQVIPHTENISKGNRRWPDMP